MRRPSLSIVELGLGVRGLEVRDLLGFEIGDDELRVGLGSLLERMQPGVHGLSRGAEGLADIRGGGPQLARLQDARGLQLIEITPKTMDGLERLEREIRRLEMPDEATGKLQDPDLGTAPGFGGRAGEREG